jgi:hypothetical protein
MQCPLNLPRGNLEYSPFTIAQTRPFRASMHWRLGFLSRVGLSVRRPHVRRSPVNDTVIVAFLVRMEIVMATYAPTCVFNMNEIS